VIARPHTSYCVEPFSAYTVQWINSLRNGMLKNCPFGTYRAATTKVAPLSIASANPATIRIRMPTVANVNHFLFSVHFEENKIRIRMNETTGEIKDVIVDGTAKSAP
jgi:hypothetical protein